MVPRPLGDGLKTYHLRRTRMDRGRVGTGSKWDTLGAMSEGESENLELEVAVLRGSQWVHRATFRPPAMISVGSSPSTVLALPDSDLPEYHELIRIYSDGGVLFFRPGMAVELRLEEGTKRNDELLEQGLAVAAGAGWKVPLGLGSRGTFRVSEVSVLFKVGAASRRPVRATVAGEPTLCAGCGKALPFAVIGFGALSPCAACGTMNEVQPPTSRAPASKPPVPRGTSRPDDLPTFDAISIQQRGELRPGERVARERLSDLPTFDAISVSTATVDPGARKAEGDDLSAPTRRMPQWDPLSADGEPTQLDAPTPVQNLAGTDLPTFDAISVLKQDAHLSTVGAMDILRGGAAVEPPMLETSEQPAGLGGTTHEHTRPVLESTADARAPFLNETSSWSPGSEVEVVIEEEDEFFGAEPPPSLDLQRSYNAIPVFERLSEVAQIAASPSPIPVAPQVLGPNDMTGQAETLPDLDVATWTKGAAAELRSAPGASTEPSAEAAPKPVSPTRPLFDPRPDRPRAVQRPGPDDGDDAEEGDDDDDFLMGRVSIPEVDPDRETNRWLLVVGATSGIVGLALILYGLFA
jgi:hypothetical protein